MVTTVFSFFQNSVVTRNRRDMSQIGNEQQEQASQPEPQTTTLFAGLKAAIVEHSNGKFLRLKDGESIVVTVDVQYNADPAKCMPREEEVDNYDKTGKVWKLRLDCIVGTTRKVFYVGPRDKSDVVALLESGVRKIKIARFGSTAQTTKYVFTGVHE
jgi:hypothetical protein